MKILHITATHLNKYGGIPVVLEKLVKHQNEIEEVESRVLSIKHDINNIESKFFYFLDSQSKIEFFLQEYEPDITIFHGYYFKEYINTSKILEKEKLLYYIQPHSSFMKTAQKKGRIKKYIANKLFFSKFVKNAFGYIFLNENEQEKAIFKTNHDLIIPNGITILEKTIGKVLEEKIKIFFLGRIDIDHKGLDILLESLKEIDNQKRDFILDIYGIGSDRDVAILKNSIDQLNYLEVDYKGPVYGKEKDEVFKRYNMMILTSRYEGFPMTILEALSHGIPCIVTEGTNVKSMIEKNNLGWGTEKETISQTVLKGVEDYKNNQNFYVTHTSEYVNEFYNWEHIAKLSVEKLRKIAAYDC
ncbi:glycosyltransferase [Planococcus notacanthi]|uniref:Glycosyltransferase n=1 Tax=Planococcus notacanthi TaxID=3035188 RepID=A0ABT7ZEU7_9BACL|nr:glycosyltransferase [Planococcus sp. APC 4016]MDN3425676.1 glycosyltransferase [Planococcus sp. APC 4016]